MEQEEDFDIVGLMEEPEGYYPPTPPPTQQIFTMASGREIALNLVGSSPTEAHHLWNGAKVISDYLEADASLVRGKTVLELGAAAGLPSLVAGILGADKVVMTDFNDPDLVQNMQRNIDACGVGATVVAEGFVWGRDVARLLGRLPPGKTRFDVLILADLLFRHSEHGALVKTIRETMDEGGVAYVFFTSYRPWKRELDIKFFDVARDAGMRVDRVLERKLDKPLFENDPGDVEVQKTVTGYALRW